MNHVPNITDTEWKVMRIIWAHHPITAAEIIEYLTREDSSWHPKTVRTLLARLVQKKALAYEPQGRTYVYEPRVTERDCVAEASETFLERVFSGSLQPLLAHFVGQQRLTERELGELRSLLDDVEKNKTPNPGVSRAKNQRK